MKKDFTETLKESGLKVTPTRLAILNVFSEGCKPVCAEDIYRRLVTDKSGSNKKPGAHAAANLVTVYRTLISFEMVGILSRVDLHKESAYYELASHHHHHIVCTECGVVEGFDNCDVASISKKALRKSSKFSAIQQHSLEFFGVCKSCVKG